MARLGFFHRIGRALRHFWEELSEPVNVPEPTVFPGLPEEEEPDRPEPETRPGQPTYTHRPYRKGWRHCERTFWDSEPNTYREYYNADEWKDLQEAFHYGWIQTRMTKAEHEQWRDRFYRISGVTASSFDWDAYREYLICIGSPTA